MSDKMIHVKVTPKLTAVDVSIDGTSVALDENQEGDAGPYQSGSTHNLATQAVGNPGTTVVTEITGATPKLSGGVIPDSGQYLGANPITIT